MLRLIISYTSCWFPEKLSLTIASAREKTSHKPTMSEPTEDLVRVRFDNNAGESMYWQPDVDKVLQCRTREMLEAYTGVPSADLISHVQHIQKRSWNVAPYPSVGALTWLNPYILLHSAYTTVLEKVKNGASILDCACMVAQDLRQLAYAGAPTENMYGFDIELDFFDIGFSFYNDRDRWKGSFIHADATQPFHTNGLGQLEGKIDIIWCAKFIHIFDRKRQVDMMVKLLSLLSPQPGAMFVGSQNGFPGGRDIMIEGLQKFDSTTDRFFLADAADIEEMWTEVARRTATEGQWDLQARLLDLRTLGLHEDDGTDYKRTTGYNVQWTATRK